MIDAADMERLKEVFVTRRECDTTTDAINEKLAKDYKEIGVINAKLNVILGILSAVGVAVLGAVVKIVFGG